MSFIPAFNHSGLRRLIWTALSVLLAGVFIWAGLCVPDPMSYLFMAGLAVASTVRVISRAPHDEPALLLLRFEARNLLLPHDLTLQRLTPLLL
jgi:hypothetical protein